MRLEYTRAGGKAARSMSEALRRCGQGMTAARNILTKSPLRNTIMRGARGLDMPEDAKTGVERRDLLRLWVFSILHVTQNLQGQANYVTAGPLLPLLRALPLLFLQPGVLGSRGPWEPSAA